MSSNLRAAIETRGTPSLDLSYVTGTNKSGVLFLIREDERGEIHLKAGEIFDAGIQGKDDLTPDDAALRLMQWDSGSFEFNSEDVYTPKVAVTAPTQELLLEAAKLAADPE